MSDRSESAAQGRLLKAAEAVLAKCESSGYLIGTKEYVNLCVAVKDAGGTDSWKARHVSRLAATGAVVNLDRGANA